MNADELLTVDELAKRLKVKPTWVYEQMRGRAKKRAKRDSDLLPGFKMGKYWRFTWPSVSAYLERRQVNGVK